MAAGSHYGILCSSSTVMKIEKHKKLLRHSGIQFNVQTGFVSQNILRNCIIAYCTLVADVLQSESQWRRQSKKVGGSNNCFNVEPDPTIPHDDAAVETA